MNPIVQMTFAQIVSLVSGLLAFSALLSGAFKLGVLQQRIDTAERTIIQRLDDFHERFAAFEQHINSVNDTRQEWAAWRSSCDAMIGQLRADQERTVTSIHDVRGVTMEHETRIAVLESHPLQHQAKGG